MKVYIIAAALLIVLVSFSVFQMDNNQYLQSRELHKIAADDAADAAALYYDEEKFSEGVKIFDKTEGNKAVLYILKKDLSLTDGLISSSRYLKGVYEYYTYYFDGDGTLTTYNGDALIAKTGISYPYRFLESLTGYEKTINEATVIVTINAGEFDYRLSFIDDPECIRTSGYEYLSYQ